MRKTIILVALLWFPFFVPFSMAGTSPELSAPGAPSQPLIAVKKADAPAPIAQKPAWTEITEVFGRATLLSKEKPAPEIPEVPEGWERARSNPYFAFQYKQDDPMKTTLNLQDLRTGAIQEIISVSFDKPAVIGSTYDVSPDGKVVIYEVRNIPGNSILDENNDVFVQSIEDPAQKVVFNEQSVRRQYVPDRGNILKNVEYGRHVIKLTVEVIDGPDQKATVLEKTYSLNTQSMKLSEPFVKLTVQGEDYGYSGFLYDPATGLAIHKTYTSSRPFLDIYDARRGTDKMRLIARLQFDIANFSLPPEFRFLDYRFTNTSLYQLPGLRRRFVTVSAIALESPFPVPGEVLPRKTIVYDVLRGRSLELEGTFTNVTYTGHLAVYTLETAPGVFEDVTVNLRHMSVV